MTDSELRSVLSERIASVRARIAAACQRAGRAADGVTLVAVTKTVSAQVAAVAAELELRDLGENRVQEAASKVELVRAEGLRWHLIGHLQSNKARLAVKTFDVIHTIDSVELADRLDRICGEEGRRP